MREESSGGARSTPRFQIPEDYEEWGGSESYTLCISRSAGELMLTTNSYHPGVLRLTRKDLEEILARMG